MGSFKKLFEVITFSPRFIGDFKIENVISIASTPSHIRYPKFEFSCCSVRVNAIKPLYVIYTNSIAVPAIDVFVEMV